MRINAVKISSTCKDGSLVQEYLLNTPVTHDDILHLQKMGAVDLKNIGETDFFTFSAEILTMKGMVGDTIVFVTHQKSDAAAVELMMNRVFC